MQSSQKISSKSDHGATFGAITLTGDPRRWAAEPGMPGVVRYGDPYKYRSLLSREGDSDSEFARRCLEQIEETLLFEVLHTNPPLCVSAAELSEVMGIVNDALALADAAVTRT